MIELFTLAVWVMVGFYLAYNELKRTKPCRLNPTIRKRGFLGINPNNPHPWVFIPVAAVLSVFGVFADTVTQDIIRSINANKL